MSKVLVKFLPFEARLILDSTINRRLGQFQPSPVQTILQSFSEQRNALSIDVSELTNTLKEYFNESFKRDFDEQNASGGVTYAPFSHVSLSSLSRRQLQSEMDTHDKNSRFLMDSIVYGEHVEPEFEVELIPVKNGNLRTRRAELYLMTKTYDGVAVFERDGEREVPTPNFVQAKQLQAQADVNGDLLQKLKNSDPSTGLNSVTEISLSVNTQGTSNSSVDAPANASKSSVDVVIIIAVIVAACSMILLAFALYVAFRRRQKSNQKGRKTKEVSPRTRNTDLISPTSANNEKPPVRVMELKPDHDDNISEYTESVYSAPIRKAAKSQAQRQWLKEQVSLVERKPAKVSSRFNPKYIISGRSNASSSDVESDQSHGASEEMEGVPSLPTPVKMAMNNFGTSQPPLSKYTEQGEWTSSQIDDDITSSLNAYVHPVEASRKKKEKTNDDLSVATSTLSSYAKNLGLNRKDNDDTSVASYTSFGFSLDGVGDQSTLADNSTKYGY